MNNLLNQGLNEMGVCDKRKLISITPEFRHQYWFEDDLLIQNSLLLVCESFRHVIGCLGTILKFSR